MSQILINYILLYFIDINSFEWHNNNVWDFQAFTILLFDPFIPVNMYTNWFHLHQWSLLVFWHHFWPFSYILSVSYWVFSLLPVANCHFEHSSGKSKTCIFDDFKIVKLSLSGHFICISMWFIAFLSCFYVILMTFSVLLHNFCHILCCCNIFVLISV